MCKKNEVRSFPFTATEYVYMAKGYYEGGQFEAALDCIEKAAVQFRNEPKEKQGTEEKRLCWKLYACIIGKIGGQREVRKAFLKAKKLLKKYGDVDGYADCLIEEGTAADGFSKPKKAIKLRKKALKESVSPQTKAKAWYFLGATYIKIKKYDKAEEALLNALEIGDKPAPEYLLFALGCVKVSRKQYEESLKYLLGSLTMRKELYVDMPFHEKLGEIYALVGDVYSLLGLFVKAVKFYVQALYVYEGIDRVTKTPLYKETLLKLYHTYDNLGESDRAKSYLKRWEKE